MEATPDAASAQRSGPAQSGQAKRRQVIREAPPIAPPQTAARLESTLAPRPAVHEEQKSGAWNALKRTFDVLFAAIALLALLPLLIIVAAAIKLDSRGPLVFRQRRYGRDMRPFTS
jgi:lipopolysaccharide/colanic/teichoic acid biosynthesis glycosyltransferase